MRPVAFRPRLAAGVALFRIRFGGPKKSPDGIHTDPGISLFHPRILRNSDGRRSISARFPGGSSDSRFFLLTAPSRRKFQSVAFCGFRPRSQRRARLRFTRSSLLSEQRARKPIPFLTWKFNLYNGIHRTPLVIICEKVKFFCGMWFFGENCLDGFRQRGNSAAVREAKEGAPPALSGLWP
jgi:hypothetical protein